MTADKRDNALEGSQRPHREARHYGVHVAQVIDVNDPEGQGRVRVHLPWAADRDGEMLGVWARLATLMAGDDRGSWFVPDVDDEVLVAFEAGDLRRPYVVGALWNGQDRPPEQMDGSGRNDIKTLQTRSGVKITFDDSSGAENLTLETPGGQKLQLGDDTGRIDIEDSHGNLVRLDSTGVSVETPGTTKITASKVEISASLVTVDAAMSNFSGVVKCDTMISNAVVASSYTPGVGNIS